MAMRLSHACLPDRFKGMHVEGKVLRAVPLLKWLSVADRLHLTCPNTPQHGHTDIRLAKVLVLTIGDDALPTDAYGILNDRKQRVRSFEPPLPSMQKQQ